MATCECGCGAECMRTFLPGHDHTLRIALEGRAGGLLSLRTLIDVTEAYASGTMRNRTSH
jgi:hypothetical protein